MEHNSHHHLLHQHSLENETSGGEHHPLNVMNSIAMNALDQHHHHPNHMQNINQHSNGEENEDQVSAITLHTLLSSNVEEALSGLSPAELLHLERNVQRIKRSKNTPTKHEDENQDPNVESNYNHNHMNMSLGSLNSIAMNNSMSSIGMGINGMNNIMNSNMASNNYNMNSLGSLSMLNNMNLMNNMNLNLMNGMNSGLNSTLNPTMNGMVNMNSMGNMGSMNNMNSMNSMSSMNSMNMVSSSLPHHHSYHTTPSSLMSSAQQSPTTPQQYMNLPATTPVVDLRDGVEWITFHYTNKGRIQEYSIRIDIDHIGLEEIPHEFKVENCVYPRAMCAQENYVGNRWEYETNCNEIAWKLAWLNAGVLNAKRGLIQRAVDSYRNRFEESKSRRVVRQEKLSNGTLRRRTSEISMFAKGPKMLVFSWVSKGIPSKCRIRVDLENADLDEMDDTFKRNNCIYPRAMTEKDSYDGMRWGYENQCNEIAWKLSWLNPSKLAGKKAILQKAVEAYRAKFLQKGSKRNDMYANSPSNNINDILLDDYVSQNGRLKAEEFSEIVANTLQQALSHEYQNHHQDRDYGQGHGFAMDPQHYDDQEGLVSTAELLNNMG
jgi:hypothetical protein